MSGRNGFSAADHERGRELAAARIDEALPPRDEAWLAGHLEACEACASIAAEYAALHERLGALRLTMPQPPRDLWARTSAAIEAERGHRDGSGRLRRLRRSPRRSSRPFALAPALAMVAIAAVVGATLLNGRLVMPGGTAGATPIAIKGAADLQVLALDSAGNLQLLSRRVDEVCPTGVIDCGVSPTFAVTSVSSFGQAADLLGAISPTGGQMVVIRRDPGSQGVYVVPVKPVATPPVASTSPSVAQSSASHPVTAATSATASALGSTSSPASPASTPSESPSAAAASPQLPTPPASPVTTPTATTPSGPASASPSGEIPPTPTPTIATASASEPGASAPPSSPSPEISPAPDAAIKIASGVTVVGAPTYSPDGTRVAFSAMPSDASAGPDIYVWSPGDQEAHAITGDHDSWLAGWTASGILVSRVNAGTPTTYRLDPDTGHAEPIGAPGTWLPAVSPTGTAAGWWSGTVRLAADGVSWVPDQGRVVVGPWPSTGDAGVAPEVLAKGPLSAWQLRWDDTGAVVAAWIARGDGQNGQLSLYRMDEATSAPDVANPMLDATPAKPDFSLRAGRVAWTPPDGGSKQVVEVLAWSGKTVYPTMELPADGSGTVVP